jgi:hypothetical protein
MEKPIVISSTQPKAQQRLFREHRRLGNWRAVASLHQVNMFYVLEFAKHAIEPANDEIAARLGIRRKKTHHRTINDHLANDPICDMPGDLLAWALAHREVIA